MSDTSLTLPVPTVPDPDREILQWISCPLFRRSHLGDVPSSIDWLWHGYLARGQITLLTGQWKVGKTTLLSALLARMNQGGMLAGQAVTPGRAVILSEEGATLWLQRCERFQLGENISWAFRPFVRKPLAKEWECLLQSLADLHRAQPLDLIVFDPLVAVLPGHDENAVAGMHNHLLALRDLAAAGPAVLLLHHPRKATAGGGMSARGTGVLPAGVDILMELHWYDKAASADRRRRLLAWSRHEATPRQQVLELTPTGDDFLALGDFAEELFRGPWKILQNILAAEPDLSLLDIRDLWPTPPPPAQSTLAAWLQTAADRLTRSGAGKKTDPFRYRLSRPAGPDTAAEGDKATLPIDTKHT